MGEFKLLEMVGPALNIGNEKNQNLYKASSKQKNSNQVAEFLEIVSDK